VRARCPEHRFRPNPHGLVRFARVLVATVALACALSIAPARAAPSTYTGEAPVESQSDADRADALKIALGNVIVEQSGDSGILSRPEVASAVAKAERYALQFRYRKNTDGTGAPLTLIAEFDSNAVDDMLQRFGVDGARSAGTAPVEAKPSEANVWIGGIRSAEDYARVLGYLARNNFVRGARPVEARGDGMLVGLSLTTDLAHFLDVLATERTLGVVSAAPPVDGVDATLALAP
jgi:hypothetical protein